MFRKVHSPFNVINYCFATPAKYRAATGTVEVNRAVLRVGGRGKEREQEGGEGEREGEREGEVEGDTSSVFGKNDTLFNIWPLSFTANLKNTVDTIRYANQMLNNILNVV